MALTEVAPPDTGAGQRAQARRRPGRRWWPWRSYLARRVGKSAITLYLVVSLSFFLIRFMPGNPADAYIAQLMSSQGLSYADAANQARSVLAFDPDAPLVQQYLQYLGGLARGDLGESITSPGTTVVSQLTTFVPWTLFSVGLGLLLSFALGVAAGVLVAYRRGGLLDHVVTNVSSFLHAVPNYVWAMLILVVFGVQFGWFDVTAVRGTHSAGVEPGFTPEFIGDIFFHAGLPILVYVLTSFGGWFLTMKSSTVQVLDEDFVTVARARGLTGARIGVHYVGRNAVLPLFAQLAVSVGFVVGGSTLIERIFQYNGVGYHLFDALTKRDYPMLQGFILVLTFSVIVANLLADVLLSRIDPRISAGQEGR
ncbi:ABC transporter permease [Jiangella alba]|uniref:Peptide/nickel transport system permease protein n=1 Tax=Jiangella alba TaxID=561176 RepID=A0A1H5PY96_9ACTN|nr:ABC transporter permease [Jiangella alba]SEF17987.1 peptide/nickel transport system permease protein [Jiangella alba]